MSGTYEVMRLAAWVILGCSLAGMAWAIGWKNLLAAAPIVFIGWLGLAVWATAWPPFPEWRGCRSVCARSAVCLAESGSRLWSRLQCRSCPEVARSRQLRFYRLVLFAWRSSQLRSEFRKVNCK